MPHRHCHQPESVRLLAPIVAESSVRLLNLEMMTLFLINNMYSINPPREEYYNATDYKTVVDDF
jgi:hypothetical protein